MQLHRITDMTLDDPALGLYTTRKAAEEAIVEHALAGRIRGAVEFDVVEVEGDPVVIVLTDDDETLVAGPFDSWADAERYSPDEEFTVAEWTVERYAQAVAAARPVTTEDLVAILRTHADAGVPDGDGRTQQLAAQLADAFTARAPFAWSAVKVGDADPTAPVDNGATQCGHTWTGTLARWSCTRAPHVDKTHVAGDGRKVLAVARLS